MRLHSLFSYPHPLCFRFIPQKSVLSPKVAIVGPSIWVWCRQLSLCLLCTAAFRYLRAEAPCNRTSIFFLCVFPKNDASFSVFPSQPQPSLSSHKGIRAKSGFSCEHKHIFDCNLLTQLLEQVRASMHSYDGFIGKESKKLLQDILAIRDVRPARMRTGEHV